MKYMTVSELREAFLKFFESKDHLRLKSFPLVPVNDKSLLLINAGMAPMKTFFTGLETPPAPRVTTCQKCIRTGDIENVGVTNRHATFFEMLGDFSFGDYFKEEIIPWSWEFCTEMLEIPAEKLFISVYQDDDEAYNIWHEKVGIPKEKLFRLGKEDNFWEVGTTGPCGPCSEIYYDRGESYGCGKDTCAVGCDCERYTEFWNLVFTQFNKEEDGSLTPLAKPNIDTGMGLERIGVIMQNVDSIMDIDTMKGIRDKVCQLSGYAYGSTDSGDISVRIITDHIRAVTFLLADGVLPNNEGRGYVLRRLLRRAARHGKLLGINDTFMPELCKTVIEFFGGAYPELIEKQEYILKILSVEENRFYETLDQGLALLKQYIEKYREKALNILTGIDAFRLYDTYGFPLELMKEILQEEHFGIDEDSFKTEMEKQREMSRSSREETSYMGADISVYSGIKTEPTEFLGYDNLVLEGCKILALVNGDKVAQTLENGAEGAIILDKTPFYAESGGQSGDIGRIETANGVFEVTDCKKVDGGKFAHTGKMLSGTIKVNERATAKVDKETRMGSMRNHSATHLLHKALREVLGGHVEQAGSFVSAERLRFDFAHFEAMSDEQITKVEQMVIDAIYEALPVETSTTDIESARKMGAMALFGEKYGDVVRVVKMEDFSAELCGGTHVKNTSQIGLFKLLSEAGVSAGVRRIEALTGKNALAFYKNQDNMLKSVAALMKSTPENLIKRAEGVIAQARELRQEIDKLKSKASGNIVDDILGEAVEISGVKVLASHIENMDMNGLRLMGDKLKDKLHSGVLVLFGVSEGKISIVVSATDDVVLKGIHAGNIIKEIAPLTGGKGGGKPNMAQAGGSDVSGIAPAMEKSKEIISAQLA